MKQEVDAKEQFRETLFSIVEYLVESQLTGNGRTLVIHYFNGSRADNTLFRAIEAVKKYTQDDLPPPEEMAPKLKEMLDDLAYWANMWDAE